MVGWISLTTAGLVGLIGCSKQEAEQTVAKKPPVSIPESQAINNTKMRNCRFQNSPVEYTYGQSIPMNPIVCDEGVAVKITQLSPNLLPSGIIFSSADRALVGTANEKVIGAQYEFYLENEAGYVRVPLRLTVR